MVGRQPVAMLLLSSAVCVARHCGQAEIDAKDIKGCSSLYYRRLMGHRGAIWLGHALHHHPHLKVLDLHHTRFGDDDAIAIANGLHNNTHLKRLHLHNNRINDQGIIALAGALHENRALEFLSLSSNNCTDEGAKALAEALKVNSELRKLDLYFNLIADEGAKAFAEALKVNRGLRLLHLDTNRIAEAGGLALAEAVQGRERGGVFGSSAAAAPPTSLGELGLAYNPMGNAAVEALMRAVKANPTVHAMGLVGTGITGAVEEEHKRKYEPMMKLRHNIARFLVHNDLITSPGHPYSDIGDEKKWHGGWHSADGPPLSSPLAPVVQELELHTAYGRAKLGGMDRAALSQHAAFAKLEPTRRDALVEVLLTKISEAAQKDEVR